MGSDPELAPDTYGVNIDCIVQYLNSISKLFVLFAQKKIACFINLITLPTELIDLTTKEHR